MKIETKIDWDKFKDQFVRLEQGVAKKIKLTNWVGGEYFGRQGINFDVIEEDGVNSGIKQFTVTSRRLILELKPLIVDAERKRRDTIHIKVTRFGEGMATRYKVEKVGWL